SSRRKESPLAPREQGKASDPATAAPLADGYRRRPGAVDRRVSGYSRHRLSSHSDQGSRSAHDGYGGAPGARHVTAVASLTVWNSPAPRRLTFCHREERMNRLRTRLPAAAVMGGRHALL